MQRITTRSFAAGGAVLLTVLALGGWTGRSSAGLSEAEPGDAHPAHAPAPPAAAPISPQEAAGKAIFEGKGVCFACHGPDATGTPVAPDLTDDAWINFEERPTAEQVRALVKAGVSQPVEFPAPMPPMGGVQLTDEEIAAVAGYVLELSEGSG